MLVVPPFFAMKTALVCTLLALVPFSSLRMVCLTEHAASAPARVVAAQSTPDDTVDPADECERICLRRPEPPPPPATSATTCVLIADPACEFLTAGAVAVIPDPPVVPAEAGAAGFAQRSADSYLEPVLSRSSPPPRG